jgi:DNA-binding transcriptional LysR family regulator
MFQPNFVAMLGELRDKPAGTVRITAPRHAAETILWPAIDQLARQYPDVKFEFSMEAGFVDLVAERFDAGVRLGEDVAKDMIAVRIGPDLRMAAVGAPSYFAAHGKPKTRTT